MPEYPVDEKRGGRATGAKYLLVRSAAADSRAHQGLAIAIKDFFLPERSRLDERTRAGLGALLAALVAAVEGEMRGHAVQLLADRGETGLAALLIDPAGSVLERLRKSGVLRDPELMAELLARVRHEALGAALPMLAPEDPEQPSLLNRFVEHPDQRLASGAMAVLIAKSRRRGSPESGQVVESDLPAELHHRLIWWVVAAIRADIADAAQDRLTALDAALCDAAQHGLAAYDEGERLETAAMHFAAVIDPQPAEVAQLLVESLGDRRIVLFTAILAHALGIAYSVARDAVLDPCADRLWLGLRALDLPREAIAQIGYALSEADPRRDLDHFADMLDMIAGIGPMEAREALAPLRLPADYRAAMLALEGEE